MSEISEEVDRLELTNGISFASLTGSEGFGGNAQIATTIISAAFAQQDGAFDFVILESGGDDARHFVTASMTITFEDGTSMALTAYVEARTLIPGEAVVIFTGSSPTDFAAPAKTAFDTLLAGLVIPEAGAKLEEGEPGPVFMAGPWRVAIVAAAQNTDLPGIGLEEKDGKEWVAIVADVTNWGSSNPAFPVEDVFVQMAESSTQHRVATGSTASAGRELDLPTDPAINIEYGATGRVVLVFSVNADRTEPSLIVRRDSFPLDDVLRSDLAPDDLTDPAGPPELQEATLQSVTADGGTIEVQYAGESKAHRVRLLGIDASETPDAVIDLLMEYEGETVWIEADAALDETATPTIYLWVDNEHGDRVLLNHLLIEESAAEHDPLPGEARFALWLESTAALVDEAQ
jgi:hypothetical protein